MVVSDLSRVGSGSSRISSTFFLVRFSNIHTGSMFVVELFELQDSSGPLWSNFIAKYALSTHHAVSGT